MSVDLPALARRAGLRRNATLRAIEPTASHAQELAALYLAVVRAWQDNLGAIMAGYAVPTLDEAPGPVALSVYANRRMMSDAPSDHAAAIAATEAEVSRLIVAFGMGVQRWALRVERWHRAKWIAGIKAGTGLDLSSILTAQPVEETLEAWIARNAALVTDISDQAKGRISDAVFRAYQNRTPARELAKELREAVGLARKRALRVASHQSAALSGTLDRERMAEAGIDFAKWRSSHKANPRPEHAARDGKVYELRSGKKRGGGETIAADDRPGMKPNCGCRFQAWLPISEELE